MSFCLRTIIFILFCSVAWAKPQSPWYSQNENQPLELYVDFFKSSTCPHCHKADAFFKSIESEKPWLKLRPHVINEDKKALIDFQKRLLEFESSDYSVPTFFFCGVKWTGYDSDKTSGEGLSRALTYCYEQIKKDGTLTPLTMNVIKRMAPNVYLMDSEATPSPFKRTFFLALFDALNPCALFALMLILSFLLIQKSKGPMILLLTILTPALGALHYLQQAQSQLYYFLLNSLRWPTALVGLGLILFALFYKKIKQALVTPILAFLSVMSVYIYQQSCIASNMSLFFQQWLLDAAFAPREQVMYQLIYQASYMLPLILFCTLLIYFHSRKKNKDREAGFEAFALLNVLAIGLMMLINPWALSNFNLSLLLFLTLSMVAWFLNRSKR